MPVQVVDLFCGVGGLTRGLLDAGLDVVAGFDIDSTCQFTYEHNNNVQYHLRNIREVDAAEVNALYDENATRVLVGCAPCQPFSQMRFKLKGANEQDDKYNLLLEFGRLIEETNPSVIAMENVPQIKETGVYQEFLAILERLGYQIDAKVIYCPDYGIPQNRERLYLIFIKSSINPTAIKASPIVIATIAINEFSPLRKR